MRSSVGSGVQFRTSSSTRFTSGGDACTVMRCQKILQSHMERWQAEISDLHRTCTAMASSGMWTSRAKNTIAS
jgi:hypothetical protein